MLSLLFYKGTKKENVSTTLWDRVICFVTRSRFSHVELSFEIENNHFICWSSSTRDGGVRNTRVPIASPHWEVLHITNAYASKDIFLNELGKKYDYIGLLGTVTGLPWFSSKSKWFCSEIVAEALGLKDSWKRTPEDLYRIYGG